MTLPPAMTRVLDHVDSLSFRERALVAVTTLAVLWAVWDGALMQPLRTMEAARQAQIGSLNDQIADLNQSIQRLAIGTGGNREADEQRQLQALLAANAELEAELRTVLRELVDPQEMSVLLETMLVEAGNLELVHMRTLAAQPITVEQLATGYYRHGLEVQVRGSYLDALRYLEALEGLQWKFLWDSVQIEVVDHPSNTVTITVYTLGRSQGAIGV